MRRDASWEGTRRAFESSIYGQTQAWQIPDTALALLWYHPGLRHHPGPASWRHAVCRATRQPTELSYHQASGSTAHRKRNPHCNSTLPKPRELSGQSLYPTPSHGHPGGQQAQAARPAVVSSTTIPRAAPAAPSGLAVGQDEAEARPDRHQPCVGAAAHAVPAAHAVTPASPPQTHAGHVHPTLISKMQVRGR